MDTLLFSINAILPVVLLIFIGYFLKRLNFLDEDWFKKGNRLVFRLLLPCLLFYNVYSIPSFSEIDWSVVIYSELVILALFFIGLLVVPHIIPDARQKGVIVQCLFRSNFAIIGLSLAESLGGTQGVKVAAVLSAFSIPTFNILAVLSLTLFLTEGEKKAGMKTTLKKIMKNPLIISVICGLFCLILRSFLPVTNEGTPVFSLSDTLPFIYSIINSLAKAASPLALIVLGGLFDFSTVKNMFREIIIGTIGRVFLAPVLGIGLAVCLSRIGILSFDQSVYPALLALFGSPVATSSAIMAQEMENDGTLAGQLVVWTSIASIVTLFVFIFVLRSLAIL